MWTECWAVTGCMECLVVVAAESDFAAPVHHSSRKMASGNTEKSLLPTVVVANSSVVALKQSNMIT